MSLGDPWETYILKNKEYTRCPQKCCHLGAKMRAVPAQLHPIFHIMLLQGIVMFRVAFQKFYMLIDWNLRKRCTQFVMLGSP